MKRVKIYIVTLFLISLYSLPVFPQFPGVRTSGFIVDEDFNPIENVHVININTNGISITDSAGAFSIKVSKNDSLYISSLHFRDTFLVVDLPENTRIIHLQPEKHSISEVKVFEWGSSYGDFKKAFLELEPENLAENLGLPVQDPDVIPFYYDEARLKSPGFAITSPISFLYHNLSKREKSRRKVYRLNRDKEIWDRYFSIFNRENAAQISGLEGEELEEFWHYLNEKFSCNPQCNELEILSEISLHWKNYTKEAHP